MGLDGLWYCSECTNVVAGRVSRPPDAGGDVECPACGEVPNHWGRAGT